MSIRPIGSQPAQAPQTESAEPANHTDPATPQSDSQTPLARNRTDESTRTSLVAESQLSGHSKRANLDNRLGASGPATRISSAHTPAISDNTPIFQHTLPGGAVSAPYIDRNQVVNAFNQMDANRGHFNPNRCGPSSALSAAIMSGGAQGLSGFAASLRPGLVNDRERAQLSQIQRRIDGGEATYGDLRRLNDLAFQIHSTPDANGEMSTSAAEMRNMMRNAGMTRTAPPRGMDDFQAGQSWPFLLDNDGDGRPNHWVLAGHDQNDQPYVYDPLPNAQGQLSQPPGERYAQYASMITRQQSNADQSAAGAASRGFTAQGPRPGWMPVRTSPFE